MKTLPVLLQVYSIRDDAERDFRAAMAQVRELGFDGVELAGLYGKPASEIRAILDEFELPAVSAHIPYQEMEADLDQVIEDARTLGLKYAAIPYLGEEQRPGGPGFDEVMAKIPEISRRFAEIGVQLLYHNHDFEFVAMPDGRTGLDTMYEDLDAETLAAEPDTCWIHVAGENPASWLARYSGRVPVVHLKDFVIEGRPGKLYELIGSEEGDTREGEGSFDFRPLGEGRQDIPSILEAAVEAGADYVVVEQDLSSDRSPMDAARDSRAYLRGLGW